VPRERWMFAEVKCRRLRSISGIADSADGWTDESARAKSVPM
jgi:hypothetical protein